MQWDVFCHVIDNYGDIGVCWRLAADLATRGEAVRLWVDDPAPLRWMAPHRMQGVSVLPWNENTLCPEPGDVVIEAFGCELPAPYVSCMSARQSQGHAPVWVNLEYLSAEPYVARNHGLPSPQLTGPGAGLRKWFYYPGFTPGTGGLLREPDLLQRQATFDAHAWLATRGIEPRPSEQRVSLFCYDNAPVPELIDTLAHAPTLLLATHGAVAQRVAQVLGPTLRRGPLRAVLLPALTQVDFDYLLWSCDLNFVRGEDSLVRALWAGRPFVWHIYPQTEGAHAHKLQAFNEVFLQQALAPLSAQVQALSFRWNGLEPGPLELLPLASWQAHCTQWRTTLGAQDDLVTQLWQQVKRWTRCTG